MIIFFFIDIHVQDVNDEDQKILKRNVKISAHEEDLSNLLGKLNVNPVYGLKHEDVIQKLETFGENRLTPPPQQPVWIKFLKELTGFFSLLVSAIFFVIQKRRMIAIKENLLSKMSQQNKCHQN